MHTDMGFEPANVLLVDTDLSIAGYRGDNVARMQRRMVDAVQTVAGVAAVGVIGSPPLSEGGSTSMVFTDQTADLRPSNAWATAIRFHVSPGYFTAARTALLAGRDLSWHDDKDTARVALVNRAFAARMFGSAGEAVGGHFKLRDATRIEVVGVVETGKYRNLTEDPTPAVFVPILQMPMSETWLVVRSERDPEQLTAAIRTTLRLGIRMALGAQSREVLAAALGRALKLLAVGSTAGLVLGLLATRVLAAIVYQATPRDPVVLAGAVLVMLALGLLATWIPARRALSLDPLLLLREE